jgi:hypothetical protein
MTPKMVKQFFFFDGGHDASKNGADSSMPSKGCQVVKWPKMA